MNNQNNAVDYKRLIGQRISRPHHQSRGMNLQLFTVISRAVETPVVQIQKAAGDEKQFSFEEIAGMAWTSLIRAGVAAGKGVSRGYMIFPLEDFWNDSQREATEYAAQIAQITVVRFVNDPVCAALAYNLDAKAALRRGKRNVLVYNHGGNALDVSLLTIDEERVFCMTATARDTHLGGDDFTNRLANYFAAEFHRKHRIDLSTVADAGNSLRRLRAACERAKWALSSEIETTIQIDSLYDGIDFCASITRPEFNRLNKDLFPKVYSTIEKCLVDAKITDKKNVHDVVLVGGSSKIPKLQQLLQEFFDGKELCKNIDPSVAMRYAAHLYAHEVDCSIRGGNNIERVLEMQFLDFTRLEIRIETGDGSAILIPKNTTIPTKKERILSTYYDNQSSMLIRVYHNDNSGALEYVISRIPPARRGVPQYKLCIDIDVDGTLSVCVDEEVIFSMTNYCHYLDQRMMGDVAEPADVAVVTVVEGLHWEEVEEMHVPKRQRF